MEQALFENFDFLVKVKVLLGQSFFFFFFNLKNFFLQAVQTGLDFQVGLGQTGVVEDDVIHDVMRRRARVSAWSVERVKGEVACETDADFTGGA